MRAHTASVGGAPLRGGLAPLRGASAPFTSLGAPTVPYPAWSLRIATCPWSYSLGTPLVPSPRHPFTLSRPPRPHDRCTLLCDSRVGRLHRSFFRSHPPGFAPLFAHVWSARSRLVLAFRLPALAPAMALSQPSGLATPQFYDHTSVQLSPYPPLGSNLLQTMQVWLDAFWWLDGPGRAGAAWAEQD